MPSYRVLPLAWSEINNQVDYLEEKSGLEVAERFLGQFLSSFEVLGRNPNIGVACGFRRAATRDIRRWPVKDFDDWLIFYLPRADGVEIVHVLHGARDIQHLLDEGLFSRECCG